jgi:hypothetical protein
VVQAPGGDREDGSSAGTICCRLGKTGQVPLADVGTLAGIAASAPIHRCRQESSPTSLNPWIINFLRIAGGQVRGFAGYSETGPR